MSQAMIYYLAWQEDEWLDEILDRFRQVNAWVPTAKTFQLIKEERDSQAVKRAVFILHAGHEQEKTREFLRMLQTDARLAEDPLYIVGLKEAEAAQWQQDYPQAKIFVITGYLFDYDYEPVLQQIEADLEGSA